MIITIEFCSHLTLVTWLQNHLLPCPFKYLTGFDCPGCGFQRSFIALLQGRFNDSLRYYPATIPLILYIVINLFGNKLHIARHTIYKKYAFLILVAIVTGSYVIKMALLAV